MFCDYLIALSYCTGVYFVFVDSSTSSTVSGNVILVILVCVILILVILTVHSFVKVFNYINHRRYQVVPPIKEPCPKCANAEAEQNRCMLFGAEAQRDRSRPSDAGDAAQYVESDIKRDVQTLLIRVEPDVVPREDDTHVVEVHASSITNETPSFGGTGQRTVIRKQPVTGAERDIHAVQKGAHKLFVGGIALSPEDLASYNTDTRVTSPSRERHLSETEPLKIC